VVKDEKKVERREGKRRNVNKMSEMGGESGGIEMERKGKRRK
jgi:hypothetical protein